MTSQAKTAVPQRVLIVSYCFAPQNIIGAVRPTKLAKYLARRGHQVTVLCGPGMGGIADPTLERDLRELTDVHVVREWNPLRDYKERKSQRKAEGPEAPPKAPDAPPQEPPQTQASPPATSSRPRFGNALYLLLSRLADRSFARRGWRTLKAMNRHFDVVISSYGPHSVHQIAGKAKARGMAERWIADFRDVVEYPFAWQRGAAKRYVRRVKEQADAFTGATEGLLEVMELLPQAAVITNGFDPEDLHDSLPDSFRKDGLSLVYCGQMYRGKAELRPVFRILSELAGQGALELGRLRLEFAGKPVDWNAFFAQAQECGLGACAYNHGLLPRDQALDLQRSAHVLLAACWNDARVLGILPGKLLEGLLLHKPILCCVTGAVPGSEAARLIVQTRTGYCWEETGGEVSYAGLKEYLQNLCQTYAAGEPLPFSPNPEAVRSYAYPQIAARFEALMGPVMPKGGNRL